MCSIVRNSPNVSQATQDHKVDGLQIMTSSYIFSLRLKKNLLEVNAFKNKNVLHHWLQYSKLDNDKTRWDLEEKNSVKKNIKIQKLIPNNEDPPRNNTIHKKIVLEKKFSPFRSNVIIFVFGINCSIYF